MFKLFAGVRAKPARTRKQPRICRLQSLERRQCLSGMPPSITSFSAQVGSGHDVSVSGQVTGMYPGFQVALSGVVSANVATDASGNFQYVGTANSLGTEYAVATDSQGNSSSQASTPVVNNSPVIYNFQVFATGNGKQVELKGAVQDESPSGLTVTFSSANVGLAQDSTSTDASGQFDFFTTASALGSVSAVVVDVWGVQSSPAEATLSVPPPQIVGFTYVDQGNGYYQFQGTISDSQPSGITVQLSGLASGSAAVDPSSGAFVSDSYQLGAHPTGSEYAVATDIWGQTSNTAEITFI